MRQLCVGRNKQTLDNFHRVFFFHAATFFALPVNYLSEISQHAWSLLELILAEATIKAAKKLSMWVLSEI